MPKNNTLDLYTAGLSTVQIARRLIIFEIIFYCIVIFTVICSAVLIIIGLIKLMQSNTMIDFFALSVMWIGIIQLLVLSSFLSLLFAVFGSVKSALYSLIQEPVLQSSK